MARSKARIVENFTTKLMIKLVVLTQINFKSYKIMRREKMIQLTLPYLLELILFPITKGNENQLTGKKGHARN